MSDYIEIKNARIHNLKNVSVRIPKNKLTVITGVSGSGKSSLAFDTLYEEGKRRYLMFSGTQFMVDSVPTFDSITGLSPTVAVEQRIIRQSNPRSTVGTRTKISSMLAALFATYGKRDEGYDDGQPLSMEMFQKNSPKGMCVKCLGSGFIRQIDEEMLFMDTSQKVEDVCLGLGKRGSTRRLLDNFCKVHHVDRLQEIGSLTEEQLLYLKYGDGGRSSFMGFIPWIYHVTKGALSNLGRLEYLLKEAGIMKRTACPKCNATGLGEQASHTVIGGKTITELEGMYINDLYEFLISQAGENPNSLYHEILNKLACMVDVGLYHLALSRPVPTLSGGEIQRLFLASYIIAEMDSIIFIFDEPTIGLHEVEKAKLISIIRNLVNRGNTVVAVEHDENFMRCADYIIDLGPGAGMLGGSKIFEGSFQEFLGCKDSRTAPYLTSEKAFTVKSVYRTSNGKNLSIQNANLHNLRNVSIDIPLGIMVGVAGVSGSGKSSLISDTLVPKLKELLKGKCIIDENDEEDSEFVEATILGVKHIKKCYVIDQKPIGRSRTSCPATYTGIFDRIRSLFSKTERAIENGYTPGLFSVNSEGGCKVCHGDGVIHYHVGFGNFIETVCESCDGTGYLPEAMEVTLGGKNIRDILEMTVEEAATFFQGKDTGIENMLEILRKVGMGYIKLGQKTPTISGGESQRIKLAKELSKGQNAKDTLYILDEPTTGLSFYDSERLMKLMDALVDRGNTVIVTEHDPYILSNCDYIVEMGPGGGSDGGNVIAMGTPQELRQDSSSIIGRYLK
ncbi:MAG TPA: excinuclease ABC subunit UvrA [Lachnospiraceae bacterium]|nr:excinuclease ABC subunit UvrA [Lachnospiraceae bacterium]